MKANHQRDIVVCGHLCVDMIPVFPPIEGKQDYFRPGRLSIVGAPIMATGGAVSNVGLGLHRLGLPVRLSAKIGKDAFGTIIRDRVESIGKELGQGIIAVEGDVSSYTVVLNPPGVDRIFLHCPGANDTFTEEDVPDSVLENTAVFHFGYPPLMEKFFSDGGARLSRLFARAKAKGALTSLDMSLPDPSSPSGKVDWSALLTKALPQVDLFVPSVEEFLFMADRPTFDRMSAKGGGEAIIRDITFAEMDRLARWAIERGAGIVVIKIGDRGVYLRTGSRRVGDLLGWTDREMYAPIFMVPKVVGTTGSGDTTIAGFLASVYKGLDPAQALTMAEAVGACCVEAADATSGIRTWADTEKRVKNGWRRAPLAVTEPGWKQDPSGVWLGPNDKS